MKTVMFTPAREGGVKTKVDGRVAFPDRRWTRTPHPAPQPGDEWEVTVSGENPRQTVCFLLPVRRVSTKAEREAAEAAEKARHEKIEQVKGWGLYYPALDLGINEDFIVACSHDELKAVVDEAVDRLIAEAGKYVDIQGEIETWATDLRRQYDVSVDESIKAGRLAIARKWNEYRGNLSQAQALANACGVPLTLSLITNARGLDAAIEIIAEAYKMTGEGVTYLVHLWRYIIAPKTPEALLAEIKRRREFDEKFYAERERVLAVARECGLEFLGEHRDFDNVLFYKVRLPEGIYAQDGRKEVWAWWRFDLSHCLVVSMHAKDNPPSGYTITEEGARYWMFFGGWFSSAADYAEWYPEPLPNRWIDSRTSEEYVSQAKYAKEDARRSAGYVGAAFAESEYPLSDEV